MYRWKNSTSPFFLNCSNAEIDLQISIYGSKIVSNDVEITSIESADILGKQNCAIKIWLYETTIDTRRVLNTYIFLYNRAFFSTLRAFLQTRSTGQKCSRY